MAAATETAAPLATTTTDTQQRPRRRARWAGLDAVRGVALWAMVLHHLHAWAAGDPRSWIPGFRHFVVTDLAAPVFALAVGAAALLVGADVHDRGGAAGWRRMRRALRRWGEVVVIGLAIDVAVGGGIDGGGVLLTLAALGLVVNTVAALGVLHPAPYALVAVGCAFVVPGASADEIHAVDGVVARLVSGQFALSTYGAFAAVGAAVAAVARHRGERAVPLWRGAALVGVAGVALALMARSLTAPDGLWPPQRYPGDLRFTLWGTAAALVAWAGARRWLGAQTIAGQWATRAGHRTLSVFAGHYAIKVVLDALGVVGELDGPVWHVVTWLGIAAIVVVSGVPWTFRDVRTAVAARTRRAVAVNG